MIIINVKGGLGNQLFQLAMALRLNELKPGQVYLYTGSYVNYSYGHKYLISDWNSSCQLPIIDSRNLPSSIRILKEPPSVKDYSLFLDSLFKVISTEREVFLDGYWANERYLSENLTNKIFDVLRPNIEDKNLLKLGRLVNASDVIGLHVRRRDYGHHGLARLSYYREAIRDIRLLSPSSHVNVFSDEPNFARFVFRDIPNLTVLNQDLSNPKRDFFLLSSSKHFILSNSTFSFWAARLGMSNCSICYFPHPYCVFNDMELFKENDLPWRVIKNSVNPP